MKYLCLVYTENGKWDTLSASESQALVDDSRAYDEALRQSGHYLAAQALQSVDTATTVRVRGSKISITDGPFAETKEQLSGFILIDASDLNDAIEVAARIRWPNSGASKYGPVLELAP